MQQAQLELIPLAPYNFDLALLYLRTSSSAVLEQIGEDGTYRRALTIAGEDVLLTLRSTGATEAPRLLLEIKGSAVDEGLVIQASGLIRRIFLLDEDPAPFGLLQARDPIFGNLLGRFYGLRPLLIADPYEALLWAIIGQQINIAFARKLKLRLVELCGRRLGIGGQDYLVLPRPADVAALDEQTLLAHQFSRQKTTYLLGVSQALADGRLDLEGLRARPYDEAIATLMQFKGIGRWTAEYVLMRGLGAPDSIPAADLGLRAIIGRAYGLDRTATEAEVRVLAEVWAGWRGWAAFFWWFLLQCQKHSVGVQGVLDSSGNI